MASIVRALVASLLPLSLAWGAWGMPVNGNGTWAEEEQTAPLRPRCQLRVDDDGDSIVLEGIVFARKPASGSYHGRTLEPARRAKLFPPQYSPISPFGLGLNTARRHGFSVRREDRYPQQEKGSDQRANTLEGLKGS